MPCSRGTFDLVSLGWPLNSATCILCHFDLGEGKLIAIIRYTSLFRFSRRSTTSLNQITPSPTIMPCQFLNRLFSDWLRTALCGRLRANPIHEDCSFQTIGVELPAPHATGHFHSCSSAKGDSSLGKSHCLLHRAMRANCLPAPGRLEAKQTAADAYADDDKGAGL